MLTNLRLKALRMAMVNTPNRGIKLHEYQAGNLLNKWKVPIAIGHVADNVDTAYDIAKKLGPNGCVVKSQILGGGRGLGHFRESPSTAMKPAARATPPSTTTALRASTASKMAS